MAKAIKRERKIDKSGFALHTGVRWEHNLKVE
jgi:hypothetical protein